MSARFSYIDGATVRRAGARILVCVWLIAAPLGLQADPFFDAVGYTQLMSELGAGLPTGTGIWVTQIEAQDESGNYAPDTTSSEFTGKTISLRSGASGTSTHANGMAKRFYGSVTSMAPGVPLIYVYDAEHWLEAGFLKSNTVSPPAIDPRLVQNHSWIGSRATPDESIDAMRRLDFAIDRDGFVSVVGVDNASAAPLSDLLAQSYNTISVGRTDGFHSHGFTTLDGAGRIKPELVAPEDSTSRTTARVSSAAAMLMEVAGTSDASKPQTMKAALMAGATKDEFGADWDRTTSRPLDDVFGAGELNVYRSYQIVDAGRQASNDGALVGLQGWDYTPSDQDGKRYFFEVPPGHSLDELSAVLTWHREIVDDAGKPGFDPQASLENLDLFLYTSTNFEIDGVLDSSQSAVDNVEHIYLNGTLGVGQRLGPGQYALEVVSPTDGIDYGLAWFSAWELVLGDMNLDGAVDFDDISVFVTSLNDPVGYQNMYGIDARVHGDTDGDGDHDFDDISGFLVLLSPVGFASATSSVPEPSTCALAAVMLIVLVGVARGRVGWSRR